MIKPMKPDTTIILHLLYYPPHPPLLLPHSHQLPHHWSTHEAVQLPAHLIFSTKTPKNRPLGCQGVWVQNLVSWNKENLGVEKFPGGDREEDNLVAQGFTWVLDLTRSSEKPLIIKNSVLYIVHSKPCLALKIAALLGEI
jgi:hypothetical protein